MKDLTIKIHAQYYENYAFVDGYLDTDNPHWKPKGGHTFAFQGSDFDAMDYELIQQFGKHICAKHTDGANRYEFVEHEIVVFEDQDVQDEFDAFKMKVEADPTLRAVEYAEENLDGAILIPVDENN